MCIGYISLIICNYQSAYLEVSFLIDIYVIFVLLIIYEKSIIFTNLQLSMNIFVIAFIVEADSGSSSAGAIVAGVLTAVILIVGVVIAAIFVILKYRYLLLF